MSAEQRRALAATIPTTEVIKDAVTYPRERLGEPLDISAERFEAWLAEETRAANENAVARAERAEARIAAAMKIHSALDAVDERGGARRKVCAGCGTDSGNWQFWPCPTVRALAEGGEVR